MDEKEQLDKMEMLRSRFNVSYEKAHAVLESVDWSTVQAVLKLEQEGPAPGRRPGEGFVEEMKVRGADLVETIKRLLHEGNVKRIVVTDSRERELINLPVTGVVALTVLLPMLTAIGAIVLVTNDYKIQVERREG